MTSMLLTASSGAAVAAPVVTGRSICSASKANRTPIRHSGVGRNPLMRTSCVGKVGPGLRRDDNDYGQEDYRSLANFGPAASNAASLVQSRGVMFFSFA